MAIRKSDAPMAAIGSYDCVLPFQAIGIETVVVSSENYDTVPQMLSKYASNSYAIVFMEESLFSDFNDDAEAINENEYLSIIPIPNQSGSEGVGVASIRKSAERAVGMDIFKTQ